MSESLDSRSPHLLIAYLSGQSCFRAHGSLSSHRIRPLDRQSNRPRLELRRNTALTPSISPLVAHVIAQGAPFRGVMEDHWSLSANAFSLGGRRRARTHLTSAISHVPPQNVLLRAVHYSNLHAIQTAHDNVDSHVAIPEPPEIPLVSESQPALILFSEEAYLTRTYNVTLTLLRKAGGSANCADLLSACRRAFFVVKWIAEVLMRAEKGEQYAPLKTHVKHDLRPSWYAYASNLNRLRLDSETFSEPYVPVGFRDGCRRWADACATSFELLSAAYLLKRNDDAVEVAGVAHSCREFAIVLMAGPDKEVGQRPGSGSEDVEMDEVEESDTSEEDNAAVADVRRQDSFSDPDSASARAAILLAIAHRAQDDVHTALSYVLPRVQKQRIREEEGQTLQLCVEKMPELWDDEHTHLPTAYVAALLLIIRGGDNKQAVRLLELCASRAYRTADSLALVSRMKKGQDCLQAWQRVFGVDAERRGGLWSAAQAFGMEGLHRQEAELLLCLEGIVQGEEKEERVGVYHLGGRERKRVSKDAVVAARASALCGAEEWGSAKELLDSLIGTASAQSTVVCDKAWTRVCGGDVEEGLRFAETAHASGSAIDKAFALLAKAEGCLRTERVDDALDCVVESFKEARLSEHGSAEGALLRGVCYHNMGVLHFCRHASVLADECFAAAQTAFEKCEQEKGIAKRLALMSGFARCVAMWCDGRSQDAAGHWIAKRDLEGVDGLEENREGVELGSCHVLCDVGDAALAKFDRVCVKVWNEAQEVQKAREMKSL